MNGISAQALALSLGRGLRSLLVAGVIVLPLAAGPAQAQIAQVWRSGDPAPASGPVRSGDSYEVMRSVRVQPGSPERHETVSDLFIVQEGAGDVRVGGELLGAKKIRPGEWYGGRIEGVRCTASPQAICCGFRPIRRTRPPRPVVGSRTSW